MPTLEPYTMTRPLQKFPPIQKSGSRLAMQTFCEILEYFPLRFRCGTNKHFRKYSFRDYFVNLIDFLNCPMSDVSCKIELF